MRGRFLVTATRTRTFYAVRGKRSAFCVRDLSFYCSAGVCRRVNVCRHLLLGPFYSYTQGLQVWHHLGVEAGGGSCAAREQEIELWSKVTKIGRVHRRKI